MVNVIVFVPAPEMLKPVERLVERMQSDEVHIDAVHCFGTPEILHHLERYDVIVARGITYGKVQELYLEKHVTHLSFDGMDIMGALLQCREDFHPNRIGLCLKREEVQSILGGLEELCRAKIRIYEVTDEQSAIQAVDACQSDGMDAVVCGGTVGHICQGRGMPYTYIHIRSETLEHALVEAKNTAISINTERTKSNIIRMILDGNEDAVLAVDESGRILEANDQAYQLYHLAFVADWKGRRVSDIHPDLTFIGNRENPCRDGDENFLNLYGQRFLVKYKLISGETSGLGTLITTQAADKILQEERKIRRGLLEKGLSAKYSFRDIIAVSPAMQHKVEMAKKFSQAPSNVLITGETGTGKELFAHSIHAASSRAGQPFVAVNCATLPETLLESELFGYEPGAFSGASREGKTGLFELAHHGTIFLDEIGEIPVTLQAKLLRVLQEREIRRVGSTAVIPVDVRVIAATNVNIQSQIAQGKLRSDLLHRLNTLEIYIPPLRERPDDILPLVESQIRVLAAEQGKSPPLLTPQARDLLRRYAWPGNVRELRNVCERLVVLSSAQAVDEEALRDLHLFFPERESPRTVEVERPMQEPITFQIPVTMKKKDLAKELGISRTTLWRMTKRQEALRKQQEEKTP